MSNPPTNVLTVPPDSLLKEIAQRKLAEKGEGMAKLWNGGVDTEKKRQGIIDAVANCCFSVARDHWVTPMCNTSKDTTILFQALITALSDIDKQHEDYAEESKRALMAMGLFYQLSLLYRDKRKDDALELIDNCHDMLDDEWKTTLLNKPEEFEKGCNKQLKTEKKNFKQNIERWEGVFKQQLESNKAAQETIKSLLAQKADAETIKAAQDEIKKLQQQRLSITALLINLLTNIIRQYVIAPATYLSSRMIQMVRCASVC